MTKIVTTSRVKRRRSKFTIMAFVAVLACVCVVALSSLPLKDSINKKKETITDSASSAPTNVLETIVTASGSMDSEVKPKVATMEVEMGKFATVEDGLTNLVVEGISNRKVARPSGFNGGSFEKIACMMMSVSDEIDTPPTPLLPEDKLRVAFYNAITNDILVFDDDDEKTVALKERVAEAKNQLAVILENGGTLTQALKEYEQWKKENKQIRDEVLREYHRLCMEASDDTAALYLAEANKELFAEGITPVTMSLRDRLKLRKLSNESGNTATDEDNPALLQ